MFHLTCNHLATAFSILWHKRYFKPNFRRHTFTTRLLIKNLFQLRIRCIYCKMKTHMNKSYLKWRFFRKYKSTTGLLCTKLSYNMRGRNQCYEITIHSVEYDTCQATIYQNINNIEMELKIIQGLC